LDCDGEEDLAAKMTRLSGEAAIRGLSASARLFALFIIDELSGKGEPLARPEVNDESLEV
jgi:hypothetical protein